MILPVSSVVTSKTISEFKLLKTSLEQFHECEWAISCDEEAYDEFCDVDDVECLKLIESDDCDHNIASDKQKDTWMKVMMTKFDAVTFLIKKYGHGLFLDSDMIFVSPIEDKVLSAFKNPDIDACICQHMTNNWPVEAQHGLYNGGMFHVKNQNFIDQWVKLSKDYKKYGFYFEQQPLEYIQRNFISLNLPINYNIGWWRFNTEKTKNRLDLFYTEDDVVYFGTRPAVNFHVHALREIGYENFGQFLVDKIKELLAQSNSDSHKKILKLME